MSVAYTIPAAPRDSFPPDSKEFAVMTLHLLKQDYESASINADRFAATLTEAEQYRIFDRLPTPSRPYGSLDAMLEAEIGINREGAERTKREAAIAIPQPTKSESSRGNQNATKGLDKDKRKLPSNHRFRRGNTAPYLSARIARDRPDILEKMKKGEYKSVRAAAKDAGIVRELSAMEKLQRLFLRLSEDEREAFLVWVSEQ